MLSFSLLLSSSYKLQFEREYGTKWCKSRIYFILVVIKRHKKKFGNWGKKSVHNLRRKNGNKLLHVALVRRIFFYLRRTKAARNWCIKWHLIKHICTGGRCKAKEKNKNKYNERDSLIHTLNVCTKVKWYRRKKKIRGSIFFFKLWNGFSACITNCLQAQTWTRERRVNSWLFFFSFPFALCQFMVPIFNSLIIFVVDG